MMDLPINQIICGDCLEVMRDWPDECIDAVVTDPPYGVGFGYDKHKDQNSPTAYWDFFEPIYREIYRVARPGALIAIWQANPYQRYFWDWFGNNIRIYAACKNFVQLRKTPINYGYDPVVMQYKDGEPLRPEKPKRSVDFFVANTAAIVSDPTRIEKGHPCPRPLDAVMQIVDNFTLPGGLIFDPFSGSGTVSLAAKQLGRRYIGIDISPEYCDIARERLGINDTISDPIGASCVTPL